MLQLWKHDQGRSRKFLPSAQSHLQPADVERWIEAAADANGNIHGVHVELHGAGVRVAHAAEARVVAELYSVDHNDYVTRNYGYPPELSTSDDELSEIEAVGVSEDEDVVEHIQKLDFEFEQNEELAVGEFGPSHAKDSNW
jgi:hypothetical protein